MSLNSVKDVEELKESEGNFMSFVRFQGASRSLNSVKDVEELKESEGNVSSSFRKLQQVLRSLRSLVGSLEELNVYLRS